MSQSAWEVPDRTYDLQASKNHWPAAVTDHSSFNITLWEHIPAADCLSAFGDEIFHQYSNILVVTNATETNSSLLKSYKQSLTGPEGTWFQAEPSLSLNYSTRQRTAAVAVGDRCLGEKAAAGCSILLHPGMLLTVIICTAAKLGCLLFIFRSRGFKPLTSIGDALNSFMTNPEPGTRNYGPVTESYALKHARNYFTFKHGPGRRRVVYRPAFVSRPPPTKRQFWFRGTSKRRWFFSIYL